jgi:hypothetical protein
LPVHEIARSAQRGMHHGLQVPRSRRRRRVKRHLRDRMGNDKVEALLFSPLTAGLAERRTASGGR